jgi:uncharacterized membrane protein
MEEETRIKWEQRYKNMGIIEWILFKILGFPLYLICITYLFIYKYFTKIEKKKEQKGTKRKKYREEV